MAKLKPGCRTLLSAAHGRQECSRKRKRIFQMKVEQAGVSGVRNIRGNLCVQKSIGAERSYNHVKAAAR